MKNALCAALGVFGGALASAFGGWDASLRVLVVFMAADYLSGLVVAGVFRRSPKSESGALESRAGLKGLVRKGAILLVVFIAYQVEIVSGVNFIRDAAIIAFLVNEALSILENAALMGVPIPETLKDSLEVLKKKSGADGERKEGF